MRGAPAHCGGGCCGTEGVPVDGITSWADKVSQAASELLDSFVLYLPSLLGAAVLLLAGWVIARTVRAGTARLGDGLNRLLDRFLRVRGLARFRLSSRALRLSGNVLFWLIILFFITAATKVAKLDAFSSWLDRIVAYLPTLIAGGLIMLFGYLVSTLVRDLVSATLSSAGLAHSRLAGTAAQGATFLTALIIGIDQIGIDVTFLVIVVAIILGAVLMGVSLAFALGARGLVEDLIGAHYMKQQFQPGQIARVGDVEGEILELTATGVVLATSEGRTFVPAKAFNQQTLVLVTPADDNE